jgi:ligand-binding SRPBCC domain-containing protein
MKIHRLEVAQNLPISLSTAWQFLSTPKNLDTITPEDMSFQIISGADEKAYPGQVIIYKIRPLFNIPMNWVTEITQCVENKYFIDEQRFGPYRFWHHQHHIEETAGGVIMKDILHYALPFGWIGELMGTLFIHKKIKGIFTFREKKLEQIFGVK